MGKRQDLVGGGLIRSAGGWEALKALSRLKIHMKGDERILGDSDFVESVIEEQKERLTRRYHLQTRGIDFEEVTDRVAKIFHLKPEQILSSGKQPQQVKARRLLCFWAIKELEMSGVEVAKRLKVCNSVVSRSVGQGEKIAADMKLTLTKH